MGNWKCHKTPREAQAFLRTWRQFRVPGNVEVTIYPTNLCLESMASQCAASRLDIGVGAQNCSATGSGAYTGEIAAEMLHEINVHSALIGHSERRANQGEHHALLATKMRRCLDIGLRPVFCFGETLEQRRAGKTNDVLVEQLTEGLKGISGNSFVVAYEPVWAIGTGVVPEMTDLAEAAASIRSILSYLGFSENLPLLYGGSVKRSNAKDIMSIPEFNGLLIGGASLDADHLFDIVRLCSTALQSTKSN